VLAAADPSYVAPAPPATPGGLVLEPGDGYSTLDASWSATAGADSYVVRLVETATGRVINETTQTGTTAIFGGLTPGTDHTLTVFAGNIAGFSPAAVATAATPGVQIVAPADPTNLVATHVPATGAVAISWTAPPGPVTDYLLIAYDTVSGYVSMQTVTGPAATFAGLPAGRSYVFGVYAHNSAGYSPGVASNVVAVPVKVVAPAKPTSVAATYSSTTRAITVTWTAPTGTVTDYLVQVHDTVSGYISSQTVTSRTATFAGLPAGRSYVFNVYARNAAGSSPSASSNVVAIPALPTAPAAPTSVVAATTSAKGAVKVTWTAPAGPVTSYVILAYDTVTGLVMTKTVTAPTTTATFTGLKAGRTYRFTVQAKNTVGTSPTATSNTVKVLK